MLTAGRNALNMLFPSRVGACLARKVQPRKVNDVSAQPVRRRFLSLQCRVAGGISAPGSHRTVRNSLPLHGSYHPVGWNLRVHAQCTNRSGSRCVTPFHHALRRLNPRSRLYFFRAQRIR